MSPRLDVSEERKEQILDAALDVMGRRGIDETRMDDIVEKTGLSKGALYWYFKSKNDIIIAIVDRIFQRQFAQIEQAPAVQTATEGIWQFTDLITADIRTLVRLMPVTYEFLALAFRNKSVQLALKRYFKRYMGILIPIIQSGIDSGEFKRVQAADVAIAVGAILEGTMLLWVYEKSAVDPIRHIRHGIGLIVAGIQVQA